MNNGFLKSVLLSAALFIFGDKIVTILEIVLRIYDSLLSEGDSQPKYVLEFSLLALVLGISLTVRLNSLSSAKTQKSPDQKHDQDVALLTGALIGVLAGLLEITRAALSKDLGISEYSYNAFLFFLIYVCLFWLPVFHYATKSVTWVQDYVAFFDRNVRVLLTALLFGGAIMLAIGAFLEFVPLVQRNEKWWHNGKGLLFDPVTLVVLGALWGSVGFDFERRQQACFTKKSRLVWYVCYAVSAFIFGSAYFVISKKAPLINENIILTSVCFGFVSVSPFLALGCTRLFGFEKLKKNSMLVSMIFVACSVALAMFGSLSFALDVDIWRQLGISLLLGFVASVIPLILKIGHSDQASPQV